MMVNVVLASSLLPFQSSMDWINWLREWKLHGIGSTLTGYLLVLWNCVAVVSNTNAWLYNLATTLKYGSAEASAGFDSNKLGLLMKSSAGMSTCYRNKKLNLKQSFLICNLKYRRRQDQSWDLFYLKKKHERWEVEMEKWLLMKNLLHWMID